MTEQREATHKEFQELRVANPNWFSEDNMRFFSTKIMRKKKVIGTKLYFVTSDHPPRDPDWKAYSLRCGDLEDPTLGIETVGKFHSFDSEEDAWASLEG